MMSAWQHGFMTGFIAGSLYMAIGALVLYFIVGC